MTQQYANTYLGGICNGHVRSYVECKIRYDTVTVYILQFIGK